jgi:DNA-binding NarL/FixJ family response regulator
MAQHQGVEGIPTSSFNLNECQASTREVSYHNPQPFGRAGQSSVISIAVIDELLFTRECIIGWLRELGDNVHLGSFESCDNCLQATKSHDLVLYHAHQGATYYDDDGVRPVSLRELSKIASVIILSAADCPETIVKAFDSGVRGYIPMASTGVSLAIEIIRFVLAGGTFVPPSGLSLRRNEQGGAVPWAIAVRGLTPRQREVLDHLKMGKANKMIAHELGVSESTVKVHIRGIMKKMRATNRTEVACRAYGFATHLARTALATLLFGVSELGY